MLAEVLVHRVDWEQLPAGGRAGAIVGGVLLDLFSASGPVEAQRAFERLENVLFAQDDVYGVAEPAVDVLLAGLAADPPVHVQVVAIDALFHVVRGRSPADPGLAARIRERAMGGVWLLSRMAIESPPVRGAAVELLELLDGGIASLVEGSSDK